MVLYELRTFRENNIFSLARCELMTIQLSPSLLKVTGLRGEPLKVDELNINPKLFLCT